MYENRIDFNTVRQYGKDNIFPACRAVFCETRDGSSFHFQFPEEDDEEDEDAEGMYFISTLPWVRYTSLLQPVAGGDESNPRITWGKYAADPAGRVTLPVSLLAHHALVDGIHIARFYQNLEENLKSFGVAP